VNINLSLANRALARIGIDPLTFSDRTGETLRFRTIRDFYLQTFLEALSEVPWTGGRKRAKLVRTGRPRLGSGYRCMYDVPFDCARPIELGNNEYFVIEDRFLCTDADNAELLYITNGKILRTIAAVTLRPGDIPDMEYITAGRPGDKPELVLRMGRPADVPPYIIPEDPIAREFILEDIGGIPAHNVPDGQATYEYTLFDFGASPQPVRPLPEDPVSTEDYPDYQPPEYEPKFYEYVEKTLAAKVAIEISKQPELHVQLLQEAMLIREGAVTASMGASAARRQPQKWWKEELGL
jgi:hypothetical protein